jgi:hypothetical protein
LRIYIAGFYSAHGAGSPNARISKSSQPAFVLESYHYMNQKKVDAIREETNEEQRTIFLDSGAFSMFTQGVDVNLKAYAEFVKKNADIVHLASNLDAIGAGHEQLSYDRQKELEALGAPVKPVHHVRDADEWLQRYLDEGYDYIFLGGMVPENTPTLMKWLDHVWHKYLTKPDGTPKVKVHGFGLTTLSLMFRYPWFSVDSTSWVMTSRFGSIFMDFPQPDGSIKDYKIDFSSDSSKRRQDGSWHFDTLKPPEKEVVMARLAELEAARPPSPEFDAELAELTGVPQGFNPQALATCYGWRDRANIDYFRRAQGRRVDKFLRAQETLF